jgi:putative N6-adenine-specific DNA methylase
MDTFFAVTAPGLSLMAAQEFRALSLTPEIEPGGIAFKTDLEGLYRANLHLRTVTRVLARLGQPVSIRVTCHKSKLFHSDAVAERIAGAIYDRLGKESPMEKQGDEEFDYSSQLIVVRVARDQVTVSIDSSGDLLHRRGYRLAVGLAPLRETLAAGLVMASGWDLNSALLDPFCGSGTICIEAAQMALGIPAGINRRFAFMNWDTSIKSTRIPNFSFRQGCGSNKNGERKRHPCRSR